mmetsp:Transcript_7247/g.15830  ORF Transcript_7247/g.15830 Transcript_7247/m.15830 type:complete len:201 (-) Transcript_7247:325-927(-)
MAGPQSAQQQPPCGPHRPPRVLVEVGEGEGGPEAVRVGQFGCLGVVLLRAVRVLHHAQEVVRVGQGGRPAIGAVRKQQQTRPVAGVDLVPARHAHPVHSCTSGGVTLSQVGRPLGRQQQQRQGVVGVGGQRFGERGCTFAHLSQQSVLVRRAVLRHAEQPVAGQAGPVEAGAIGQQLRGRGGALDVKNARGVELGCQPHL